MQDLLTDHKSRDALVWQSLQRRCKGFDITSKRNVSLEVVRVGLFYDLDKLRNVSERAGFSRWQRYTPLTDLVTSKQFEASFVADGARLAQCSTVSCGEISIVSSAYLAYMTLPVSNHLNFMVQGTQTEGRHRV